MRRLLILLLVLMTGSVCAETTYYITDEASIPVRSGKTTGHKIKRMLKSGTAVEVLETSKDGWTRVRTSRGTEGWVLSRYLLKAPIARDRLDKLQSRFDALKTETDELRAAVTELRTAKTDLEQRNAKLQGENDTLRKELEQVKKSVARPLEIAAENQTLKKQLASELKTIDELEDENRLLKKETRRNWFLTGAGVALISLFLGLIIPRIPWRRRRGWGEL